MRKYFGTDGIRRIANTELSPVFVYKIAKAGAYVLSKHAKQTPTILIGRDTRISGNLMESALMSGFLSLGANVKLLGVIPTPAVAYLTRKLKVETSVVISASHNTFEYNGIKYFSNKGTKIPDEKEEEIEQIIDSDKIEELCAQNDKIGLFEVREDLMEEYINFFVAIFQEDLKEKIPQNFVVGIDTANGATYQVAPKIFERLGIPYQIINNQPNGININQNCGSTHLEMLQEHVKKNHLALGIAYDGDGDRCLFVNEKGEVVDGDVTLALCAKYLKDHKQLKNNTLVATVMSNIGLTKFCKENDIELKRTQVGDRYVLEDMLENDYNMGGEQSGHVIFLDHNPTGDGILTSLMMLKIMLEAQKTISELSKDITIYPQVLINAKVNSQKKYDYDKNPIIKKAIEELEKEFEGNGRVLIRPSGTEPLVRVMLEGEEQEIITQKAKELANLIETNLQ